MTTLLSAAVCAAGVCSVAVLVGVVLAFCMGVISKSSCQKRLNCRIARAGYAAVQADPRLGKCRLCAAAATPRELCRLPLLKQVFGVGVAEAEGEGRFIYQY